MSWGAGAEPGGSVFILGHPAPSGAPSRALLLQMRLGAVVPTQHACFQLSRAFVQMFYFPQVPVENSAVGEMSEEFLGTPAAPPRACFAKTRSLLPAKLCTKCFRQVCSEALRVAGRTL